MRHFVIFIAIICISFFVWSNIENKKRRKKQNKKGEKPLFRTEDDLEEYGKPMTSHPVDFDDAE